MASPISTFAQMPDGGRFSFPSTQPVVYAPGAEDDTRLTVWVKAGPYAICETDGWSNQHPASPDVAVIALINTEPPALSPSPGANLADLKRQHEWNTLVRLAETLPLATNSSTLWNYCRQHMIWPMRSETQLRLALQRLGETGLVAFRDGAYWLTGAGYRRYLLDRK